MFKKISLALFAVLLLTLLSVSGCGKETLSSVDIDLSLMEYNDAYAFILSMSQNPERFIDKMIRIKGKFVFTEDENTHKTYLSVSVRDNIGNYGRGLEFEPTAKTDKALSGFKIGDIITVEGTFDTYTENGITYGTLRNAVLSSS